MNRYTLLLSLLLIVNTAGAQNFEKRHKSQKAAIETAYKKKLVTEKEYYKLLNEQDIIKRTIETAKADDVLTPKEKNNIHAKQERAGRRIKRYKTNREVY